MLVGGSSFTEVTVRQVRIIQAVKTDHPFVIIGDVNDTLLLPEYEADWAVTQGYAAYTGITFEEAKEQNAQQVADILDVPREVSSQSEPEEPAEPEPPKRPYGNAPKSSWVAYVVAVEPEMTVERAEGMSKADLMSGWGQRL
jgi:hypothetical protein